MGCSSLSSAFRYMDQGQGRFAGSVSRLNEHLHIRREINTKWKSLYTSET